MKRLPSTVYRESCTVKIIQAEVVHRPGLETLLEAAGLPVSDLPGDLSGFFLAFDGDQLVGSAGVQPLGSVGLLRSVAVDPAYRNRQIGQQLQQAALAAAQSRKLQEIYLITTTAERYFEAHGFQRADRATVPAAVAETEQFTSLCALSAIVLKKNL